MKKDVEDKIAKCQANVVLEAISQQCEQILDKHQKADDFKRIQTDQQAQQFAEQLFSGKQEPTVAMDRLIQYLSQFVAAFNEEGLLKVN